MQITPRQDSISRCHLITWDLEVPRRKTHFWLKELGQEGGSCEDSLLRARFSPGLCAQPLSLDEEGIMKDLASKTGAMLGVGHPVVNRGGSCSEGLSVGDTGNYNCCTVWYLLQQSVAQDNTDSEFLELNSNRLAYVTRNLRVDFNKEVLPSALCVPESFNFTNEVFFQTDVL